jgi:hypothetical protein
MPRFGSLLLCLVVLTGLAFTTQAVEVVDLDAWRDSLGNFCQVHHGRLTSCGHTSRAIHG